MCYNLFLCVNVYCLVTDRAHAYTTIMYQLMTTPESIFSYIPSYTELLASTPQFIVSALSSFKNIM